MAQKPIMIPACKALLTYNGRALLVRRSEGDPTYPGMWELPGGKMDFGETPQQAALREIMEETGIEAKLGAILYADSSVVSDTRQILILLYSATAPGDEVTLSFEHADYLWATRTQMREMLGSTVLETLDRYDVWNRPEVDIRQ